MIGNLVSSLRVMVLSSALFSLAIASVAFGGVDAEPNDDFASAQVLAPGDLTVAGELEEMPPIFVGTPFDQEAGTLVAGGVISHDFTVPANELYTAYIDNSVGGADTTLQALDHLFNVIATDDDSSPVGNGVGSSLTIAGNSDGTLHLRVSGFDDFDFDGLSDSSGLPHTNAGDYRLILRQGALPAMMGDVDIYAFTGLNVGQMYVAETFSGVSGATPDTVLGWYDNLGTLNATDDDSGEGTLSQLMVTVPADGTVYLGVSGFSDFGFIGQHGGSGSYSLSLAVAVPEPGSGVMVMVGLLTCVIRRRRKLERSR